jgi:hypothetical protein
MCESSALGRVGLGAGSGVALRSLVPSPRFVVLALRLEENGIEDADAELHASPDRSKEDRERHSDEEEKDSPHHHDLKPEFHEAPEGAPQLSDSLLGVRSDGNGSGISRTNFLHEALLWAV